MPLPYKEPSQVLAALMDKIIDEGRRFASAADMKVQAVNDGMRTLIQDAVYKVLMGQTDFAQLQRLSS